MISGVAADAVAADEDITSPSAYYELNVDGPNQYVLYGGCGSYASMVSQLSTARVLFQPHSIVLQQTNALTSDATSFNETRRTCSDGTQTALIVERLTSNQPFLEPVSIFCNGHSWVTQFCAASDADPAICVDCINPCSPTAHCVNSTGSSEAMAVELSPYTIAPCAAQNCPAAQGLEASSAIRALAVRFEDLDEAPSVVALTVSATRNTLTIDADLSDPGVLYCDALLPSSGPPATTSVITNQQRFVKATTNSTTLGISGLLPATDFVVYCVTASPLGTLSDVSAMLATQRLVSTACCKRLTLQLSNAEVAENIGVANLVTYTFSSLPGSTLTVTPQVYRYLGSNDSSPSVPVSGLLTPGSATVSSTDVSTVRRASLNPQATAGLYYFNITLTGPSADEVVYGSSSSSGQALSSLEITVYSVFKPPPAPELVAAEFSGDGSFLTIQFDSNTNRGGISTQFSCSKLFSFACVATSTCQWADDATVLVYISGPSGNSDVCAEPGDYLSLPTPGSGSGVVPLLAKCVPSTGADCTAEGTASWETAQAVTLQISAPDPAEVVNPTVNLIAPSTIGSCDDFSIDATPSTGSGGRSWDTASSLLTVASSALNNITALESYISSSSYSLYPQSDIPGSLMNRGFSYTFYLTLCNFLGECATGSKRVVVQDDVIPLVTIGGSALRSISRAQRLDVSSNAFISICGGGSTSAGLAYQWTVYEDGVLNFNIQSTSVNPGTFRRNAFSMESGSMYRLVLNVVVTATLKSASSEVLVEVIPGDVVAVLAGGTERTVLLNESTLLDASGSYDEDVNQLTGTVAGLSFSWTCSQTAPVFAETCAELLQVASGTEKTFSIAPLNSAPVDASAEITLLVSASSDSTRFDLWTLTVTVLPPLSPSVDVASNVPDGSKLNPAQSLRLAGSISLPASATGVATWTVPDSSVDLSAVALSPLVWCSGRRLHPYLHIDVCCLYPRQCRRSAEHILRVSRNRRHC